MVQNLLHPIDLGVFYLRGRLPGVTTVLPVSEGEVNFDSEITFYLSSYVALAAR